MKTGKRQAKKSFVILLLILLLSIASNSFCQDLIIVEDFDSYADSYELLEVWIDGWVNDTDSEVRLETTIAHNVNSMMYEYWNYYPPYYSEADAYIDDLGIDRNWLGTDANELTLWFYGQADNNVSEQMYIKLTDWYNESATVLYSGDMNDIREEEWHEWNIALQDFTDNNPSIDLTDVRRLTIGFGDGSEGGAGTLYFEDIRLYPPR